MVRDPALCGPDLRRWRWLQVRRESPQGDGACCGYAGRWSNHPTHTRKTRPAATGSGNQAAGQRTDAKRVRRTVGQGKESVRREAATKNQIPEGEETVKEERGCEADTR